MIWGRGVGKAGAAEPRGVTGWETAQDRHARGDGSILYLLGTAYRWRCLPRDSFPPRSTVYNIFATFNALASESDLGRATYDVARADGPRGQPLGGGSR